VNLKSIRQDQISSAEKANVLTHAFGLILSLIGFSLLLIKAYQSEDFWKIFSAYVFGGSLILLYAASTFYHAAGDPKVKAVFHLADHAAIFILIAGTYTPFLLVGLRSEVHVSFIIILWGIALSGIIYKVFMIKKYKLISTFIYLAMGWMAIFKFGDFYKYLSLQALIWIVIGGISYSVGTIFYSKTDRPVNHAIWHLFVLGGSISHFIAIYFYVY
jgi:hemolysin III